MNTHKIFTGALLLAFVLTVSLLTATRGIVQLAENAFKSAWLPPATKDRYMAELKAYAG